ncbi:hypothetical protein KSP39_PZI024449 [Platanthera zijinensis]|uniref:Uncharacterized protein n=1 Tax=Platanthera zijinensis TaxID=2320716 RepID=A0AAP0AU24_9ASPA
MKGIKKSEGKRANQLWNLIFQVRTGEGSCCRWGFLLRSSRHGGSRWSKRCWRPFVYPPSGSICSKRPAKTERQMEH